MQGKLSEMVDEVSGKIVSKEMKMREEALQRFLAIEKRMRALECGQMAFEKGLRQDNEKRLTALQRLHQQELTALRDLQKVESNSIMQQYRKMDEDVARLASNLDRSRHELRKVVKAEIMKRDSQVKELQKKTNELKEHLQVAITALQQAISGTQQKIGQETERLAATMRRDVHDSTGRSSRVLADVDSRLVALAVRAAEHEERFEQIAEERIEEVKDLRNSLVRLQGEVRTLLRSEWTETNVRRRSFVKRGGFATSSPLNHWGLYQAVRWLQLKQKLLNHRRKASPNHRVDPTSIRIHVR
ncbi:coiled-coil domain-containing protein 154-like [Lethenteron reissneri]|uniref:coiled-coil domain-containing protein 154-like n=1 Tax=Lethenteron reissneri TaxID=7753 RepID=UPI002AB7457B|nr:coiled-coil domain-containing protein 154-like [Lethenteron reissneri]